jgi:hypothetical protein
VGSIGNLNGAEEKIRWNKAERNGTLFGGSCFVPLSGSIFEIDV